LALRNFESFARKRKKPSFGKNMKKNTYICFDIGGTKILKAVVEISGEKFKLLEVEEEKNPREEQEIKRIILDFGLSAEKKYKTNKISISTTRIVDPKLKTVSNAKDRYGVETFSFKFLENKKFNARVANDGQCFAMGEYFFGKSQGKESALTLALGTGIGGGFVSQKRIFNGNHFSALEVSHSKYHYEGKWEEWGDLADGYGIEEYYYALAKNKVAAREVFERAEKGDKKAVKVIKRAGEVLGVGIANLINILDPEIIIFGGSISKQKQFISKVVKITKQNVFNKKANYKFAISSLGNKANLLGAASLYF
jgi:glucokinase